VSGGRPATLNFRSLLRLLGMAGWLAFCAACHLLHRLVAPSPWPRRFLRGIGWIAGARVRTTGAAPGPRTLIVANHVSWLDIPVLAGATGCAFVAKLGLKGHPVMRWLCEQNGTVFVDRDRKASVGDQLGDMARALAGGQPLCLFPEGTVGEGGRLLPFRSALLRLAEEPPFPLAVQPVAVDYGPHAAEFGWPAGERGTANFLRLIGRRGTVAVTLHFLEPLAAGQNRKQLALAAHGSIARALDA
jgi:lyso-ornithine lipid O-acyltransferase